MSSRSYDVQVDWISFLLKVAKPSNGWSVKRVFDQWSNRKQHTRPVRPGPGGAADLFLVRLQEPPALRGLNAFVQANWPGAVTQIVGIEVAFDTYIGGTPVLELAQALTEQFFWMQYRSNDYWYFYRIPGEGRAYVHTSDMSRLEMSKRFMAQWQLTDQPNKFRLIRFHLHLKTTDAGQLPLPQQLWRARFEVTLKRGSVPWTSLADLIRANFAKGLRQFFQFRRAKPSLHRTLAWPIASPGFPVGFQPGRQGAYPTPAATPRAKPLRRRKFRAMSSADTTFNAKIYDALRHLRGTRDP
jgi:hypothetical protein